MKSNHSAVTRMRRLFATLVVAAIALFASAVSASAQTDSVAVLGDSISRGYNSCGVGECLPFVWSTGSNPYFQSLADRIAVDNGTPVARYNDAVSGARMEHLNGQAQVAVTQQPDLVTIEMGGNDVCRSNVSLMTETGVYQQQFRAAMDTLTSGAPSARILVLSVPDVYLLWDIFKANPTAQFVWSTFNVCRALTANPTSTDPADVARRDAVRQQVVEYNKRLAQNCAKYPQCTFDDNAVFNAGFVASDITFDFFHPSIQGQAKLAAISYQVGAPF